MQPKGTVLLIGGDGFIGKIIGMHLAEQGYAINCVAKAVEATKITLGYPCQYFCWDGSCAIPTAALDGVQTIINLIDQEDGAAKGWLGCSWQELARKRIKKTAFAVAAANTCGASTFIQESSIDFYGSPFAPKSHEQNASDLELTEAAAVGQGSRPEAIAACEEAVGGLNRATRMIMLRAGEVFSIFGGPFRHRLETYCLRMGGPQIHPGLFQNWLHRKDYVRLVQACIEDSRYQGPINAVAPLPCSLAQLHEEFCASYPDFITIPMLGWLSRLMSKKLVNLSYLRNKAVPAQVLDWGFDFEFASLKPAMADLLNQSYPQCFYHTSHQWVPERREVIWDFYKNAHNMAEITPHPVRLELKPESEYIAREGVEFDFHIYYYGRFKRTWRVKHVNLVRPSLSETITQEGMTDMVQRCQTLTEVAGGTRIDELMRYQIPFKGIFTPLSAKYFRQLNSKVFLYRQQIIAKKFGNPDKAAKNGCHKAS